MSISFMDKNCEFDLNDPEFTKISLLPGFDEPLFRQLLIKLTDQDVSDVHIETNIPIWIRRFGQQRRLTDRAMTSHEMTKIVSWLYQSSNAMGELAKIHDINKKYSAISGDGTVYSYRLNAVSSEQTMGTSVRIALRPIPRDLPTLEQQVDLDPNIREAFIHSRGIGFVVGETGNGKSTLLAALNRDLLLNAPNRKLLTWEAPIEFDLFSLNDITTSSHVSQHEIGVSVKTFYDGVVNSLRSAPTDILVGESKDRLTLDATLHSGETGHKTNTTIHAGSVRDTFLRIASEYPPAEQSGVIYKTLVNVNFVLVQKLMERPGGGRRYPLREWFIFDDNSRRELLAFDDIKASLTRLDEMVREKKQDFYSQSVLAYSKGLITEEAAKVFDIEMRQKEREGARFESGLAGEVFPPDISTGSVKLSGLNSAPQEYLLRGNGESGASASTTASKNIPSTFDNSKNHADIIRTISEGFNTLATQIVGAVGHIAQSVASNSSRGHGGTARGNCRHDDDSNDSFDFCKQDDTRSSGRSHDGVRETTSANEQDTDTLDSEARSTTTNCRESRVKPDGQWIDQADSITGGSDSDASTDDTSQSSNNGVCQAITDDQSSTDAISTQNRISQRRASWNERFARKFEGG